MGEDTMSDKQIVTFSMSLTNQSNSGFLTCELRGDLDTMRAMVQALATELEPLRTNLHAHFSFDDSPDQPEQKAKKYGR